MNNNELIIISAEISTVCILNTLPTTSATHCLLDEEELAGSTSNAVSLNKNRTVRTNVNCTKDLGQHKYTPVSN